MAFYSQCFVNPGKRNVGNDRQMIRIGPRLLVGPRLQDVAVRGDVDAVEPQDRIPIPTIASDTTITVASIVSHRGKRFSGCWVMARPPTLFCAGRAAGGVISFTSCGASPHRDVGIAWVSRAESLRGDQRMACHLRQAQGWEKTHDCSIRDSRPRRCGANHTPASAIPRPAAR